MRPDHIFYLLVVVLGYWFSFPSLGKPENNSHCDGLFSSEQCEFITSLKSEIDEREKENMVERAQKGSERVGKANENGLGFG